MTKNCRTGADCHHPIQNGMFLIGAVAILSPVTDEPHLQPKRIKSELNLVSRRLSEANGDYRFVF
jgi:hypothetical protein